MTVINIFTPVLWSNCCFSKCWFLFTKEMEVQYESQSLDEKFHALFVSMKKRHLVLLRCVIDTRPSFCPFWLLPFGLTESCNRAGSFFPGNPGRKESRKNRTETTGRRQKSACTGHATSHCMPYTPAIPEVGVSFVRSREPLSASLHTSCTLQVHAARKKTPTRLVFCGWHMVQLKRLRGCENGVPP